MKSPVDAILKPLLLSTLILTNVGFPSRAGEWSLPSLNELTPEELDAFIERPTQLPLKGAVVDMTGYSIQDPIWIGDPGWVVCALNRIKFRRQPGDDFTTEKSVSHLLSINLQSRECMGIHFKEPTPKTEPAPTLLTYLPSDGDTCLAIFEDTSQKYIGYEIDIVARKSRRLQWSLPFNPNRLFAVLRSDRFTLDFSATNDHIRISDRLSGNISDLDISPDLIGRSGRDPSFIVRIPTLAPGNSESTIVVSDCRDGHEKRIECLDVSVQGPPKWTVDNASLEKAAGGMINRMVAPFLARRPCRRLPLLVTSTRDNRMKTSVVVIDTADGERVRVIELPLISRPNRTPVMSPNSRWISFQAGLLSGGPRNTRLFCVNLETTEVLLDDNPYSRVLAYPFAVSNDGVLYVADDTRVWAEYPLSNWATRPIFQLRAQQRTD